MAVLDRNVGNERRAHELGIRIRPRHARADAHVTPLVEAVAAGAAGDLGDLPRLEITPLLAVELRGLGEEERLAWEVDAVPQNIGRRANLRAPGDEAVDLLP